MKIIYTKHAQEKLRDPESKKFFITKKLIKTTILLPKIKENLPENLIRVTDELDDRHSLVVVYKKESGKIIVITFFPAKKGRYEVKILR